MKIARHFSAGIWNGHMRKSPVGTIDLKEKAFSMRHGTKYEESVVPTGLKARFALCFPALKCRAIFTASLWDA
jgi:hypothetical protein